MTTVTTTLGSLDQRLRAVGDVLLRTTPASTGDVAGDAGALLAALIARTRSALRADHAWLLHVAVSGHLPLANDVDDILRNFELARDAAEAEIWLLRHARRTISEHGPIDLPVRVVTAAVVIDVSYSAQYDKHTGIQRVTRAVCTRWHAAHDITLTTWMPGETALRSLVAREQARVLAWSGRGGSDIDDSGGRSVLSEDDDSTIPCVLIPWRSTVVLPEVAQGRTSGPLAALAQYSGNTVVAIGYDAIPVVSAELRPAAEPNQFVGYLTVLKHAQRVAGISASATAEFRGFADAARAQGITGPDVAEVMLAAEVPPAPEPAPTDVSPVPLLVCVGSHEPHKNHLAVLHAAEILWRDGLTFELTFIGGPGWDSSEFDTRLAALLAAGRPVVKLGSVTEDELWAHYRRARFSVFPSLHEGFGLPVAESLACGTPAVTTRYGSTGEIAARGGCLLVDPRDDHELADAMRTLLTDGRTYSDLKAAAASSVGRTWDAYAEELWTFLIDGKRYEA